MCRSRAPRRIIAWPLPLLVRDSRLPRLLLRSRVCPVGSASKRQVLAHALGEQMHAPSRRTAPNMRRSQRGAAAAGCMPHQAATPLIVPAGTNSPHSSPTPRQAPAPYKPLPVHARTSPTQARLVPRSLRSRRTFLHRPPLPTTCASPMRTPSNPTLIRARATRACTFPETLRNTAPPMRRAAAEPTPPYAPSLMHPRPPSLFDGLPPPPALPSLMPPSALPAAVPPGGSNPTLATAGAGPLGAWSVCRWAAATPHY
jgi:hypothetical protein